MSCFFFFQAEDGIRDWSVTGVQTCALPIYRRRRLAPRPGKAPRAVVERVVGADAVLEEAMDHLVQRAYRDALRSEERRVGKECRSRVARADGTKKEGSGERRRQLRRTT